MTGVEIAAIVAIAFAAASAGTVAGGTSLFTVPALVVFGVNAHEAVATNIAGLTALSAAASWRFARAGALPARPTLTLAALSLPAGALGGALAISLPERTLELVVSAAMLAVAGVFAARAHVGAGGGAPGRGRLAVGYAAAALLGVYSGLFSGGYVTLLTLVCVACFGTSLLGGIAITKAVNLLGSGAATAVFAASGAISWPLAAILIPSMALGGLAGAALTVRLPPRALRFALAFVVAILAVFVALRPHLAGG